MYSFTSRGVASSLIVWSRRLSLQQYRPTSVRATHDPRGFPCHSFVILKILLSIDRKPFFPGNHLLALAGHSEIHQSKLTAPSTQNGIYKLFASCHR